MTVCRAIVIALVASALAPVTAAQVEVSLPLQGYYRVGQYMPVLVQSSSANEETVTLQGEGLVPTEVRFRGSTVAPVLVVSPAARALVAGARTLPLRQLGDDDALVGILADRAAPDVTGRKRAVTVRLDAAVVRGSAPLVWDPLDAIVLDDLREIAPDDLGGFIAAGVSIHVRSSAAPNDRWPWQRTPGGWVLRAELPGPASAFPGEPVYAAAHAWARGTPGAERRLIVLGAVVYSILVLACMLWNRAAERLTAVAVLTLLAAVLLSLRWQSPLRRGNALVDVMHDGMHQRDTWWFFTSSRPAKEAWYLLPLVRPILFDAAHASATSLRLFWHEPSRDIRFQLRDDARIAFVARRVTPDPAGEQRWEADSVRPEAARDPMVIIAGALYLRDGWRIVGVPQPRHVALTKP